MSVGTSRFIADSHLKSGVSRQAADCAPGHLDTIEAPGPGMIISGTTNYEPAPTAVRDRAHDMVCTTKGLDVSLPLEVRGSLRTRRST